jgi:hypothetical protein
MPWRCAALPIIRLTGRGQIDADDFDAIGVDRACGGDVRREDAPALPLAPPDVDATSSPAANTFDSRARARGDIKCVIFEQPAGIGKLQWGWRSCVGTKESSALFPFLFDCVQDAEGRGYVVIRAR